MVLTAAGWNGELSSRALEWVSDELLEHNSLERAVEVACCPHSGGISTYLRMNANEVQDLRKHFC
eukprot:5718226-Amphidinium_carterae.1